MYMETWRGRLVAVGIGAILVWSGGYGLLNTNEVPLNLCYSRDSLWLQRVNSAASAAVFAALAAAGLLLIWFAGTSAVKSFSIREDRAPIDGRLWIRAVVAHVFLVAGLAACVWAIHEFVSRVAARKAAARRQLEAPAGPAQRAVPDVD